MSATPNLFVILRNFAKRQKEISERLFRFPLGRAPSLLNCQVSLRFRVGSLIELSELDKAEQIFRLAVCRKSFDGWDSKVMLCNDLISSMCKAKRHDDAVALFHHCFKEHKDFFPDIISCLVDTLRLLTKFLVSKGRIYEAMGLIKYTRISDSVVYSYLIRGFLDQGNHDKAYDLSDEFIHMSGCYKEGRAVVDAIFVGYWFKQGEDEKAMELYRSLISRSVCASTGNTLLEILFDNGKETEAWDLFNVMLTNSLTFNRDTFGTVVNACFKLRRFKLALQTFKRPEFTRSSRCYANIIPQFCEHGMMSQAQDLFDELCSSPQFLSPDVPTLRSLINGYAKAGRVDDALRMLKLMVDSTLLKFPLPSAH
ncbi:hypothetical protein N665_2485s0009 [Sinapis alba]|nr:hypothetical protein N665_2485s0009 [Sinapis alba]